MDAFSKKIIGCNIVAALLFLTACQESNEASLKQTEKVINSTAVVKDPQKNETTEKEKPKVNQTDDTTLEPLAEIFFSKTTLNPSSQKSFNCDDQVFTVIKFANHKPKLHQINISWKDPNGTERENNSFPFFVTEKETLAWASLKLHRSVGAGMLQWVNPAAGMEEFIGTWSIDVEVGSLLKRTANFEVLC